jgi:tetratricopeptide (TPR) repeat protein
MTATNSRANAKSTRGAIAGARWARARTRNGRSPIGSKAETSPSGGTRIERLIEREQWAAARKAILAELNHEPDSHWLLTRLGLTYYEQRKYDKALEYAKRALRLQPNCPLVLWDYAGALAMLGKTRQALRVYQSLLDRGVESVAYDECGEGLDWAMALLNDCHYRMARWHEFLGDKKAAQLSYLKYLHNCSHGVASIYDVNKAEAALAAVSQGIFHVASNGAANS